MYCAMENHPSLALELAIFCLFFPSFVIFSLNSLNNEFFPTDFTATVQDRNFIFCAIFFSAFIIFMAGLSPFKSTPKSRSVSYDGSRFSGLLDGKICLKRVIVQYNGHFSGRKAISWLNKYGRA